jgi:hypothetical protein
MSMITSTAHAAATRWLPSAQFRAMGFEPGGPEIDCGMRWGDARTVRVSFAPYGGRDDGFLYAHDPSTDRDLLLVAHATLEQVDAAWRELNGTTASTDGYLALASLVQDGTSEPMTLRDAQALLSHCLDREFTAYERYVTGAGDAPTRFDAGFGVIVQRSARVAAEDLLLDTARAASPDAEPVVVRYRLLDEPGWSGRIAGSDLESACTVTSHAIAVAGRHELKLQPTSLTHGNTTVAAARVPELAFATMPRRPGVQPTMIGI